MLINFSPTASFLLKSVLLVVSSMHFFAMVILLPFMNSFDRSDITEGELAIIIIAHTCGAILATKWTDYTLKLMSVQKTINWGLLVLFSASLALWILI